jgi:hypothetical protein
MIIIAMTLAIIRTSVQLEVDWAQLSYNPMIHLEGCSMGVRAIVTLSNFFLDLGLE